MTARCRSCGRRLRDAVSIAAGLGPKCRRAALTAVATGGGQLALDIPTPARPTRRRRRRSPVRWPRRYRGRRVTTLPDIATYQPKETAMPEIRLTCLSLDAAAAVVAEATRPGDTTHTVRQDEADVVIGYFDKRWPLDVADWAGANGHASDSAAARVIAQL